jgi:hypothetical protein
LVTSQTAVETVYDDASSDSGWQPLFFFVSVSLGLLIPPLSYTEADEWERREDVQGMSRDEKETLRSKY